MKHKSLRSGLMATTTICGAVLSTMAGVAVVAGVAALPSTAFAQDYTTGSVGGVVTDASGAPVAGATVTLTSNAQGIVQTATTGANGAFNFTSMPIGTYTLKVEAAGSATYTDTAIEVEPSKSASFTVALTAASSEAVVVRGTTRKLAFSSSTTGVVVDVEKLTKTVPLGRNLTSLMLLAPTTSTGDAAFGNLASVGGASVAENAYYLNGLNITDFNNYLGGSVVPFDFYKTVEVKEGGYPAEFGRATGGVVNAITKSGTNEFKGGVHFNFSPNELRTQAPNTTGSMNQFDKTNTSETVIEMGGPIIKDRLFAYGLVQYTDSEVWNGDTSGTMLKDVYKQTFYGLKLDGYINPDHHVELTYFDTTRVVDEYSYDYDGGSYAVDSNGDPIVKDRKLTFEPGTGELAGEANGYGRYEYGDPSFVLKYTGRLTDWFTVSAAYGKNNDKNQFVPVFGTSALKRTQDATVGPAAHICGTTNGCNGQTVGTIDYPQLTERTFYRVDGDLFLNFVGSHHVRFGMEQEENLLIHDSVRTGGGALPYSHIYRTCGSSVRCSTGTGAGLGLTSTSDYVELNYFNTGGSFESKNIAYYIQDEWKVNNRLTLNLGVRVDEFNNYTANGSQYVDFNGLVAPRLAFSYALGEDNRSRVYGSYGVYYLPIAGNTAFRQGASETFFREYWTFTGVGANNYPILGSQLTGWTNSGICPFPLTSGSAAAGTRGCNVSSNGTVQDPTASVSKNIEATQESEFILGYERKFGDLWSLGVSYTHRNLDQTAEDSAIDAAVNAYCAAEGITGCSSVWTGYHQYVINNPGQDMVVVLRDPIDGETDLRTVTLKAADLGYPKAVRKFDAVTFNFRRAFDGVWTLQGSYTYSKSEGNSEGYVQSDFGQDDAGITQDFDQPGFTDYSYGYLPTHRAHRFKVWGSYQVTDALTIGGNVSVQSPRKLSCFGYDPTDRLGGGAYQNFENGYGAASHYCYNTKSGKSEPSPRGEGSEGEWIKTVDMSARYRIDMASGYQVVLRADVFNLLNGRAVDKRNEIGDSGEAAANPFYDLPTAYQTPRSVRFGLDINF